MRKRPNRSLMYLRLCSCNTHQRRQASPTKIDFVGITGLCTAAQWSGGACLFSPCNTRELFFFSFVSQYCNLHSSWNIKQARNFLLFHKFFRNNKRSSAPVIVQWAVAPNNTGKDRRGDDYDIYDGRTALSRFPRCFRASSGAASVT